MALQAFLLEKSHVVDIARTETWSYDQDLQLNAMYAGGKLVPVCASSSMTTGSKTDAAPGDDDPDPDVGLMY